MRCITCGNPVDPRTGYLITGTDEMSESARCRECQERLNARTLRSIAAEQFLETQPDFGIYSERVKGGVRRGRSV